MSGKKGMGHQNYTMEFKAHIVDQIKRGEISIRGYAREYGINRSILQQWRRECETKEITIPKRKGRPRTRPITAQHELELRIKELEREVELYRSFLHAAGRM